MFKSRFISRGPYRHPNYTGVISTAWRPAHYNDFDVDQLHEEHGHLRWSVFAMHWSIIGWCATYDQSTDYIRT